MCHRVHECTGCTGAQGNAAQECAASLKHHRERRMLQGARQLVGRSVAADLLRVKRAGSDSASSEALILDSNDSVNQAPAAWQGDNDAGSARASAAEVDSQTPSSDPNSATVTGGDDGDRASAPSHDNAVLVTLEENSVASSILAGARTVYCNPIGYTTRSLSCIRLIGRYT